MDVGPIRVVFCHGLESGPVGTKSTALLGAGFGVLCPDGRGMRIAERVASARSAVMAFDPHVIVGSSYGGPVALLLAEHLREGALRGVLLCAPALGRYEPPMSERALRASHRTVIVHGRRDEVVPAEVSRTMAAEDPNVTLLEVDDDHGLAASLPTVLEQVRALARQTGNES